LKANEKAFNCGDDTVAKYTTEMGDIIVLFSHGTKVLCLAEEDADEYPDIFWMTENV
jgi:hypothetical protein